MPVMAVVVLLTMIGAAWPVLFWDGSALAKNLEKRLWVDAVDDRAVAATMEAELFGEEPATETISTYDPKPLINKVRMADKSSAILCILLAAALPFLIRWKRQTAWLYLLPSFWLLLNAYAVASNGGKAHAELAIPAHATRWMLPIALALLTVMTTTSNHQRSWNTTNSKVPPSKYSTWSEEQKEKHRARTRRAWNKFTRQDFQRVRQKFQKNGIGNFKKCRASSPEQHQ